MGAITARTYCLSDAFFISDWSLPADRHLVQNLSCVGVPPQFLLYFEMGLSGSGELVMPTDCGLSWPQNEAFPGQEGLP